MSSLFALTISFFFMSNSFKAPYGVASAVPTWTLMRGTRLSTQIVYSGLHFLKWMLLKNIVVLIFSYISEI